MAISDVGRERDEAVGAGERLHRVRGALEPVRARGGREQLGGDLGVGGAGELVALVFEVVAQELGVDDVAVVAQRERAVGAVDADGLGVLLAAGAGGGVAGVADGDVAGEVAEVVLLEDLRDEAHAAVHVDAEAVGGGDAGALLAAVLEGVEAVEGDAGDVFVRRVDAEDAALLSQCIGVGLIGPQGRFRSLLLAMHR